MTNSRRDFMRWATLISGTTATTSYSQTQDPTEHATDVLVIGAGPAGMCVADKLTAKGIDVLLVESGVDEPDPEHQSLNDVTGSVSPIQQGLGFAGRRAVGGTSHVWGGICPRFDKSDFRTASEFGYGIDWPISFAELNHYYCEAEAWLRVSNIHCGNSARSELISRAKKLTKSLDGIGLTQTTPAAMLLDRRGLAQPFNVGLLATSNLAFRANFRMIKNLTARRIEIKPNAELKSVHCSSFDGQDVTISAKKVVLCCGAIQNARLLLLSKSHAYPDGVGNAHGHVGANFMDHPNVHSWVEPKDELLASKDTATFVHALDFYREMKSSDLGSALLRFAAYSPEWQKDLPYKYLPESRGVTAVNQTLLIEALCEQEPQAANRISLSRKESDRFGDALAHLDFGQSERDRATVVYANDKIQGFSERLGKRYNILPLRLSSHHLMGTTRMAKSPKDGVVDENLKVHGTNGVYVAGASAFPTGGAANPTLTLTALALRLADFLVSSRTSSNVQ